MVVVRRVASVMVVVAFLAGCGSNADDSGQSTTQDSVSIEHQFGTTQVPRGVENMRIVTLTAPATDAVLAMGLQPVAYSSADAVDAASARYPWQGELGDNVPFVPIPAADTLPVEDIATYAPDLVLGDFAVSTPESYARLSSIAPTVPAIGATVSSYDALTRILGDILGRTADADAAIARTDTALADTAEEYPALADKTALLAQYIPATQQIVVVADPDDGATSFYRALNMQIPDLGAAGVANGRLVVGPERLDVITSDLAIMLVNGGTVDQLEALPGYAELPSVRNGAMVVTDLPTIVALNTPSPLSLLYALDQVRLALAAIGRE
ncbi:Fe(3+)-citrate-binding protein YfmC [Rhodococcus sp. PBTS 1]|nr:Fe(3+)-citrate-binding protein YfmC [Rhodococcus sp. PBTS 1]